MEHEIQACLDRGNPRAAFDLIVPFYQDRVYRLSMAILGDPGLAEDSSQEAFLRIWKGLAGFRSQSTLSTWIYSIARNTALTSLQAASGHRTLSLEEPAIRIAAEDRQQECAAPTRAGFDVTAMIAQLPSRYGQVIRLYYMQDKSYDEVAQLLDIPMGTVKTLLHRARKELATALAQSTVKGG
jgi:RNA polymerase sigma-70 factor (ECF subfamily)